MFIEDWKYILMFGGFISIQYFLLLYPFNWRAKDWIKNKEIRPYLTILLIQYIIDVLIVFCFSWISCIILKIIYNDDE